VATLRVPAFSSFWLVNISKDMGFFRGNNKIILGLLPWKKGWETLGHKPSVWFPLGPILANPAQVSVVAKRKIECSRKGLNSD